MALERRQAGRLVAAAVLVVLGLGTTGCVATATADPATTATVTSSTTPAGPAATAVPTSPVTTVPSTTAPAPPTTAPAAVPPATGAPPPGGTAARARQLLATLPVKGRAPMTGYDRALYGQAWADEDHNGCDTRNDVLRRDLVDIVLTPGTQGCVVLTGTLLDPYTGTTIAFTRGQGTSSRVQIDHVVALADSWQKGAQEWTPQKRQAFANDPRNLLAVQGAVNQQKGAGDAATWLPPRKAYRCAYVVRQVEVKAAYGVWVTAAEKQAVLTVLATC